MTNQTMSEIENDAIDWALTEHLGGAKAPDLRSAIRARLRKPRPERSNAPAATRGTSAPQANPTIRPGGSRLLVAAFAILGIGAVLGIALWPEPQVDEAQRQDPTKRQELPEPVSVSSLAEVRALRADTRAVEGVGLDDKSVAELRDLAQLEALTLRGTGPAGTITNVGLQRVTEIAKLRHLTLVSQNRVSAANLTALLVRATGLEHLGFEEMYVPAPLFARFARAPKLTSLAFHGIHEVDESSVRSVLQLRQLRALSFRGCLDVDPKWFTKLDALARLERLDLGSVGVAFFATITPPPPMAARDAICSELVKLPRLRELSLASSFVTAKGLRALSDQPIERLDLSSCQVLDQTVVSVLRRFSRLERLNVTDCARLSPSTIAELREIPSLRQLTTSAGIEQLPQDR